LLAGMVRQALAGLRQARRVTMQVHPSQAEALRARTAELSLSASCEVQVLAAPAIEPGGCLIETELGSVDARLETQFAVLERALARRRA
jgi:flagellar biosynthesis/type III secretory pathway protein FliH